MTTTTHRVEIAVDQTEADEFCTWLTAQGHDASVGNSTGSYIDGMNTNQPEANDIMNGLWNDYCNA